MNHGKDEVRKACVETTEFWKSDTLFAELVRCFHVSVVARERLLVILDNNPDMQTLSL